MHFLATVSVVLALATVVLADASEKMAEIKETCMGESKVTAEELEAIESGKGDAPSPEAQCFMGCFAEQTGMWKDGKITAGPVLDKIESQELKDEVEQCITEMTGLEDKCKVGPQLMQCLMKAKITPA